MPCSRAQEAGLAVVAARLENLEQNQALCPPGTILAFAGTNAPPGWLPCDGRAMRSSEQPRLFAAIGQAWGDGSNDSNNIAENPPDETTDFNLPDLRGLFLRGATVGSTNSFFTDPDAAVRQRSRPGGNLGDAVGSVQADEFKTHNHTNPPYQSYSTPGRRAGTPGSTGIPPRAKWTPCPPGRCCPPAVTRPAPATPASCTSSSSDRAAGQVAPRLDCADCRRFLGLLADRRDHDSGRSGNFIVPQSERR